MELRFKQEARWSGCNFKCDVKNIHCCPFAFRKLFAVPDDCHEVVLTVSTSPFKGSHVMVVKSVVAPDEDTITFEGRKVTQGDATCHCLLYRGWFRPCNELFGTSIDDEVTGTTKLYVKAMYAKDTNTEAPVGQDA